MSFQGDCSDVMPAVEPSDEALRRRRAIYQALHPALSSEEVQKALALCDREFPIDQPFSVSEFCQRLFETSSEIQLNKETRLDLLRTMRQPIEKLGSDPLPSEVVTPAESEDVPMVAEVEVSADSEAILDGDDECEMMPVLDDEFVVDDSEDISDSEFDMESLLAEMDPVADREESSATVSDSLTILADSLVVDDHADDLVAQAQQQVVNSTEQITHQKNTGQPYQDDCPSPELLRLRYANFGKPIID